MYLKLVIRDLALVALVVVAAVDSVAIAMVAPVVVAVAAVVPLGIDLPDAWMKINPYVSLTLS